MASRSTTGKTLSKEDEELKARLAARPSDFPNDQTFKARIKDKLNPSALGQLEKEIFTLGKPENADRLQQLITILASKDYKQICKLLRNKNWFPQEWLPTP